MLPERPCSCGGTFRSIGQKHLRLGDSPALIGPAWHNTETLGVEILVCDQCREMKFFLAEEPAYMKETREPTPVERYKLDFSYYSRRKLAKITKDESYLPEARQAARELLAERFGED